MSIYDIYYFLFFFGVFLLYYTLPGKWQNSIIFLASSVFIGFYSISFLVFTYLFVSFNYTLGIGIGKYREKAKLKKLMHWSGLIFNIGLLIIYKYLNFLIDGVNTLSSVFNSSGTIEPLNLIIPLGISYYTFQGIGYILQVTRKIEAPEKNIIHFMNFMMFFPKFVAGPIERSKTFLPQLKEVKKFNYDFIVPGFRLILWGAFMKMVLGDRLALIVNSVYSDVGQYSGSTIFLVFLLQPLYLYFDFAGYTNIALGIGRLFGLKLSDNFNRPFFATSVSTFWRRWHMSLSSWCNDYIFMRIILKHTKWKIWASIYGVMVSFFVIGIWHGARWTFIVLGLLQGIAISYEYFTKRKRIKIGSKVPKLLNTWLSIVLTYLFFCITLIFFNAHSLKDAGYFLTHMFSGVDIYEFRNFYKELYEFFIILIGAILVLGIEYKAEFGGLNVIEKSNSVPRAIRWATYIFIGFMIVFLNGPDNSIVYGQF